MSSPLVINDKITLPGSDLEWSAVRSSGAGGQNVNKVSSKVELSFDFESTVAIPDAARERLRVLTKNMLDAEGRIFIKSEKTRDQQKNLADARGEAEGARPEGARRSEGAQEDEGDEDPEGQAPHRQEGRRKEGVAQEAEQGRLSERRLAGLARLVRRPPLPDLAIALGMVFLPVGGIWLMAARIGRSRWECWRRFFSSSRHPRSRVSSLSRRCAMSTARPARSASPWQGCWG